MRLQYAAMCEEKAQLAEAKLEVKSFLVTRLTYNCAHLRSTKESLTFEYLDILFLYHVSIGCHWLIHDGSVSVWCSTGWFLVI